MQPLYQAVAHGCFAGVQQEACVDVYRDRISRGREAYVVNKLGAFGADLGAVACFFDPPWSRVSANLKPQAQAWLLGEAAFRLRALGRVTEALEPMRAGLDAMLAQEDWQNAAICARNLSELELTLGDVGPAIRDAEAAMAHADRSGNASWRMISRATHAHALRQAAREVEAGRLFAEAEAMQAELSDHRLLYSLRGFHYCDLLLADAERATWFRMAGNTAAAPEALTEVCSAVAKRATQTLAWVAPQNWLLDIGLDHLTLARAALYTAILQGQGPPDNHLREATEFLRRAGAQEFLSRALLARALFRAVIGAFDGTREDLDEACEIAVRGPMRLFLADIHLHRARLFGLMPSRPAVYPWTSPRDDLDAAKKLIDECGYGRRRAELADAEAAYQRLSAAG